MKLTLVRHTSLQIAEGICYGQSDIDVSVNFASELSQLKQKLIHSRLMPSMPVRYSAVANWRMHWVSMASCTMSA